MIKGRASLTANCKALKGQQEVAGMLGCKSLRCVSMDYDAKFTDSLFVQSILESTRQDRGRGLDLLVVRFHKQQRVEGIAIIRVPGVLERCYY